MELKKGVLFISFLAVVGLLIWVLYPQQSRSVSLQSSPVITDVYIYKDASLVKVFFPKSGDYLLTQQIQDSKVFDVSGKISKKEVPVPIDSIDNFNFQKLIPKQVVVKLAGDKEIRGRLLDMIVDGSGSSNKLVLWVNDTSEFMILPLNDVRSIIPLEIDLQNKTVYRVEDSASMTLLLPYYLSDLYSLSLKLDIKDDSGTGFADLYLTFKNKIGNLNDTKIHLSTGLLCIDGCYYPSIGYTYPYYSYYTTSGDASLPTYSKSVGSESDTAELRQHDIDTIYTVTIPESSYNEVHHIKLSSIKVNYKTTYEWNTFDEPGVYMVINSSEAGIPASTLMLTKNGAPLAIKQLGPIFEKGSKEVKIKKLESVMAKRTVKVSEKDYDYSKGTTTSSTYVVELNMTNNGRESVNLLVTEPVTRTYYGYYEDSSSYRFVVQKVEGVTDYRVTFSSIDFDVSLRPGESKVVTLYYKVYYP